MSDAPAVSAVRDIPPQRISLYVHIPFCETKCPYCDFNTYAGIEALVPSYIGALEREITLWGRLLDAPAVYTIFFGGGTPSYLPDGDIARLMRAIRQAFRVDADAEITLEANPGDFDTGKLASYLDCGVNRISIGVQSFDDALLRMLGRRHTAEDAAGAYRMAQDAGFRNISLDLMYGLPHQSAEQWQHALDAALELAPPHLSMYCLTLEGGTPMERWVSDGTMPEPDADLAADMYLSAQSAMQGAGYRHYEISNWALAGMESRHNLTYWRNEPYLGVGPGAHSYLMGCRFWNLRSPREYLLKMREHPHGDGALARLRDDNTGKGDTAQNGVSSDASSAPSIALIQNMPTVAEIEPIDTTLEMAETLMMGLRLDCGVSIAEFMVRFGSPPAYHYAAALDDLERLDLLTTQGGALRLTHHGRMMANQVFSRFFE